MLQGCGESEDAGVVVDVEGEDLDGWVLGFDGEILEEGLLAGLAFGLVADGQDEGG